MNPRVAVTPDTIFDIASASESLTAAAVGKLVEDEAYPSLGWDAPMSMLPPGEFMLANAQANEIVSVEDILSHRSGLPEHYKSIMGLRAIQPDTPRSITLNLRNLAMNASPRTAYQYNSIMYIAASYLVEKKSGISFPQFLQENFFSKLGMASTVVQPSAVSEAGLDNRHARPYVWNESLGSYEELPRREQPEAQGTACIQTTVADYARWVQATMRRDTSIMKEATYAELTKPRAIINPGSIKGGSWDAFISPSLSALGWQVVYYRGHRIIRHGGLIDGFGSMVCFLPEQDFGLVIFGNSTQAGYLSAALAMELIESVLGVNLADRYDWTGMEERVAQEEVQKQQKAYDDLRQKFLDGNSSTHSEHRMTLDAYVGTYENVGYYQVLVATTEGRLFIDVEDRSGVMCMNLEQVCDDQKFILALADYKWNWSYMAAEFQIGQDGRVEALGMPLISGLPDYLLWFKKA